MKQLLLAYYVNEPIEDALPVFGYVGSPMEVMNVIKSNTKRYRYSIIDVNSNFKVV